MLLNSQAPNLFYSFALQVIVLVAAVVVGVVAYAVLGSRRNEQTKNKK